MPDLKLTSNQSSIRRMARNFAQQEVLPVAWYYDEQDYIPQKIVKKAFDAGIINADIPVRYGGKGYGLLDMVMMIEELAAACPGIAMSIFDNSLSIAPLMLCNNDKLKECYLQDIATSFKLICFAAAEPIIDAATAGVRCRAEEKGNGYILNGTKRSVTNGSIADYMSIFADTHTADGYEGIGAFIVNLDTPGVSISRPFPKLGQRSSNAAGINFKNVLVPKECMMAQPNEGFALALKTYNRIRPMIGAFAVGTARCAMEFAVDHADRHRNTGGMPGNHFQISESKLADMQQKLDAARLLTWKSAWEIDKLKGESHSPSVAKLYASAWELVNDAMQVFGGYGYTKMVPIEKLFRDIRVLKIYEITGEIQRIILAGAVMSASKRVRQPAGDVDMDRAEIAASGRYGLLARHCQTCGNVYYSKKSHSDCPYCFFPKKIFTEQSNETLDTPINYHEMGKGKQKAGWTNRMKQTSMKQTNKT